MKTARHALGRWLLRDAAKPQPDVHVELDGARLIAAIRKHNRRHGRPDR